MGKINGPRLLNPKGNGKTEILLVKIFSLTQKKSNTSSYYIKIIKLSRPKKTVNGSLDKELQWVNVKQSHSDRIRHIQV